MTRDRWLRRGRLYGLPLIALAMIGWTLATDPPAPVVLFFLILLGWPLLSLARMEGFSDAMIWVRQAARPSDPAASEKEPKP